MAEVLAGLSAASECLSLAIQAISALRKFSSSVRDARDELSAILSLVDRAKNRVELIRVTLLELHRAGGESSAIIAADFVGSSNRLTHILRNILQLASDIARGESRLSIATRFRWALNKSKAHELIEHLTSEEEEITREFTIMNSSVGNIHC